MSERCVLKMCVFLLDIHEVERKDGTRRERETGRSKAQLFSVRRSNYKRNELYRENSRAGRHNPGAGEPELLRSHPRKRPRPAASRAGSR